MQNEYIDTIVLMAYKLQIDNPNLTDDEAIQKSIKSLNESHKELVEKLTALKERLGEKDWQALVEIFTKGHKTPEELEEIYNQDLNNNKLLDAATTTSLELLTEHEGLSVRRKFPAGTKIKVNKDSWNERLEFVQIWTSPKSVDYCLRGDFLAY